MCKLMFSGRAVLNCPWFNPLWPQLLSLKYHSSCGKPFPVGVSYCQLEFTECWCYPDRKQVFHRLNCSFCAPQVRGLPICFTIESFFFFRSESPLFTDSHVMNTWKAVQLKCKKLLGAENPQILLPFKLHVMSWITCSLNKAFSKQKPFHLKEQGSETWMNEQPEAQFHPF